MLNSLCSRIAFFSLLLFFVAACSDTKSTQDEGQSLIEQKKYKEALEWYNKKIEEEKSPASLKDLYYYRAIVHQNMNNLDYAMNDVNWALVIDSANAKYLSEKGDLYFQKHMTLDALAHYHRSILLEPAEGIWYYKMGKCQLIRNEISDALVNLEKAEKLGYNEADLYLQLGITFQRTGNQAKSCAAFKKAAAMGDTEAKQFSKNLGCL